MNGQAGQLRELAERKKEIRELLLRGYPFFAVLRELGLDVSVDVFAGWVRSEVLNYQAERLRELAERKDVLRSMMRTHWACRAQLGAAADIGECGHLRREYLREVSAFLREYLRARGWRVWRTNCSLERRFVAAGFPEVRDRRGRPYDYASMGSQIRLLLEGSKPGGIFCCGARAQAFFQGCVERGELVGEEVLEPTEASANEPVWIFTLPASVEPKAPVVRAAAGPEQIVALMNACDKAERERHAATDPRARRAAVRRGSHAGEALRAEQTQCAKRLADERGWTWRGTPRSQIALVRAGFPGSSDHPWLDHCEVFAKGSTPVALLSHSYASRDELTAYAKQHDLTVTFLPWSWWNPPQAIAALFMARRSRRSRLIDEGAELAHNNRERLRGASQARCYSCCRALRPSSLKQWIEQGQTALCPHCLTATVIPGSVPYAVAFAVRHRRTEGGRWGIPVWPQGDKTGGEVVVGFGDPSMRNEP